MSSDVLKVNMLGGFSLQWQGRSIDDSDNRSHKAWLLLAYLFYQRKRRVPQEELIRILWEDEARNANPQGAIKTLLHRVRVMLNALGEDAGYQIVIYKDGNYVINPELSVVCDTEEFERLCKAGASVKSEAAQLDIYMRALEFYNGDYLPKLTMEHWTIPVEAYLHELFLRVSQQAAAMLAEAGRNSEAAALCRKVIAIEPFSESAIVYLMRALIAQGDKQGAADEYERMRQQLFDNFGTLPSQEASALYREAVSSVNERAVHAGMLREQLREETPKKGALLCDYDVFKTVYQLHARQISRSGDVYHVAMFTVSSWSNAELPRRSLDVAMENLQELLRVNLRSGDMLSRCSTAQIAVILPQANYENACMICERLVRLFNRQYPHSPVKLGFSVQPLEPNVL